MKLTDAPNIRDQDLLAELERQRTSPVLEVIVRQLEQKQARRDELAALPRDQRRRVVTAGALELSEPSKQDLRHIHSVLAICGLPYDRLPIEQREFERKQGNMALDVTAGFLRDPNGEKIHQPVPFGPKARLILMHLCSEAIRQKSPTIEIADTLTGFVRDMGFPKSGGKKGPLTAFKEQLNALAACTMKLTVWNGERVRTRSITPIDEMDLWLPTHPDQRSLWPSTVTFSPAMYESLQKHALPINTHVVRAFAGSARKLDLYFWLGYRIHNIEEPVTISWEALKDQFGSGFKRDRDFRANLARELNEIKETLRKLPVSVTENGLKLTPAEPSALALPVAKSVKPTLIPKAS
ncbi:hypothetical protein KKP04_11260 [Rhodomicrobium sp. Az07]|uniref:replication protein RepA n=1 Tax=Rhodomicrobium sp. Az07 TaxID=2839034 RepID=UPI001BEC4EAC|nr:hypothetical protein [Rhodomicrobium sp. Az07]